MLRLPKILFLLLIYLSAAHGVSGQQDPRDFNALSDSIIEENPTYEAFEKTFRDYRDTLLFRELIEKSKKDSLLSGLTYGYNRMAALSSDITEYNQAILYNTKALQAATGEEAYGVRLITLNSLGSLSLRIDSIKNALDYHQEVINLTASESEPSRQVILEMGKANYGIGNIYSSIGQYELAINYYQSALEYYEEIEFYEGLGFTNNKIGENLEALSKLDEALEYYDISAEINKNLNSKRLQVLNNTGIAHVLVHKGEAAKSKNLLLPLLDKIEGFSDDELIPLIYIQYGWVELNLKNYQTAEFYLSKGLELAENGNLTAYVYDANTWLHDLWEERGNLERSLLHYKEAQQARNKISNNRTLRYVYDAVSRSEKEKRNIQMEILAKQNEIFGMQLRRNRTTLLIGVLFLILFSLILHVVYRQNKLTNEKKVMALEQSRLRSQMNPHFLFNSLNSIKLYIINNEKKKAVYYLNKFSKLVRKILEASTQKEIFLDEELDTATLYMNIENIRFNNEIEYNVSISEEVDPAHIKIPSLLLQPFLENAIWHGLSSKVGDKKIEIHINKLKKGSIALTIRDNGVGRNASQRLKNERVVKRKSVGIDITEERLANFAKDYQNSYEIAINDLYGADGAPAGTEVNLQIPLI
ncbi:tetratricopeptide repeat-containing sensor histidine kinase [Robiginitalea sp. IMCC44478]|uniref:tetratricopeptide repeat-containing sensor histidine kinase n=1 Tax=Robiginitalea sp. IMCC44478 TaxID=3459122 RepID=UPI0040420AEB